MKDENIALLEKKYPHVKFPHHMEIEDGWFVIINILFQQINDYNKEMNEPYRISIAQIKEKFGGLRFYIDNPEEFPTTINSSSNIDKLNELIKQEIYTQEYQLISKELFQRWNFEEVLGWKKTDLQNIHGMISVGECWASTLCERCGTNQNVNRASTRNWIKTYCDSCRNQVDEEYKIAHEEYLNRQRNKVEEQN